MAESLFACIVFVCLLFLFFLFFGLFFFFNDTATTEIYTLSHTTLFRSTAIENKEKSIVDLSETGYPFFILSPDWSLEVVEIDRRAHV